MGMRNSGSSPLTCVKLSIAFEGYLRVNVHSLGIYPGGKCIVQTADWGRTTLSLKDTYLIMYLMPNSEQNGSLKVISQDQIELICVINKTFYY